MSFNYNKKYELTIETVTKEDSPELIKLEQEASILAPNADLTSTTVNGVVIEDLHMEANISLDTTTTSSNGNSAEIRIFNLSKENVDRITKLNTRVILKAGYEESDFDVIFTGQVSDIETVRNNADVVTVLNCKDGWTPTSQIRYTNSFPKDTPFTDIFEDMIVNFEKHGITRSDVGILLDETNSPWATPSQLQVKKSWSYSGFLRGGLDKLCEEFGLTYQIEHSTLFIYPKRYNKMFSEVEITEDQILSLRKADKSNNRTSNDTQGTSGIKIEALLIPKLTPKYKLKVVSKGSSIPSAYSLKEFEGEYKITGMQHRLSYEGDGWTTIISCEAVE